MTRYVAGVAIAALVLVTGAAAQPYPPAFPRAGAKKIVDNDRVVVWDTTWETGKPTGMHEHTMDMVAVVLADGPRTLTAPNGAKTVAAVVQKGGVRFQPGGVVHSEERTGDPAPHAILIELRPPTGKPTTATLPAGIPAAFPRPGSQKVLENDRVIAWDYTWTPGQATPVHFHDKDVVVVYLEDGALQSTTPDGAKVVNEYTSGAVRFNARDRVHTETLVRGRQRAIIVELK